ncbi:MAG: GNAT family N-acetyltransferase [Anaerolineae bacterium]
MTRIETDRLVIRNFRVDDWTGLQRIAIQFESSEYAPYDHTWPTSEEEIRGVAEWFAEGDSFLAVELKSDSWFIGFVALNEKEGADERTFGLGYRFDFDLHGKGYATEACRAVLEHAFERLHAVSITSSTAAANKPSCRLLERLGFTKTGDSTGSFRTTEDGEPIEFTASFFVLPKETWLTSRQKAA